MTPVCPCPVRARARGTPARRGNAERRGSSYWCPCGGLPPRPYPYPYPGPAVGASGRQGVRASDLARSGPGRPVGAGRPRRPAWPPGGPPPGRTSPTPAGAAPAAPARRPRRRPRPSVPRRWSSRVLAALVADDLPLALRTGLVLVALLRLERLHLGPRREEHLAADRETAGGAEDQLGLAADVGKSDLHAEAHVEGGGAEH